MSRPVTKAVIPAAGLGTRFLPATKAQPKEMLPVIDKPAIQYVVEEAVAAGLTDILVVTGRNKRALEDHFDRSPELELELEQAGKEEPLRLVRALAELASFHYVRQGEPLGLGHAVSVARQHVGDQPFAVLLPDDLMVDDAAVLRGMLETHARTKASVIALRDVPRDEISAYGAARPAAGEAHEGVVRLDGIVEKPTPEEAPSTLAATGRYVFTPAIFDALAETKPGKLGELQLTDAIDLLVREEEVYGYVFSEGRFDVGKPLDHLRATVELAARRADLGAEFRAFITEFARREGLT